jgi:hypothetical protein
MSPDDAVVSLNRIIEEFASFCKACGEVSEADTRAKVIDAILVDVLGWPEGKITREKYVSERGYIDYTLFVRDRRYLAVEAKREGSAFKLPGAGKHRYLKLSGPLLSEAAVKEAILQVRSYCSEQGIRFAIATNVYAWIVFRPIREDMPWRDGQAIVFPSLEYICERFTDFWNLLACESVCAGSLDTEFGSQLRIQRELHRVTEVLWNADLPLQRNRLHLQLHPLITAVFEDIADQAQIEVLQSCYVHSKSLQIVAEDLGIVITDEVPKFLEREGAVPIKISPEDAGEFGSIMFAEIVGKPGYLCLLLGGIGSGKTTFLRRYQRTVGKDILDKKSVWFSIDFLRAPLDPQELEGFVWRNVLAQLRTRYDSEKFEIRRNLKNIYKPEIRALEETVLRHVKRHTNEYEEALSPYLEKWQSDTCTYVPRLLAVVHPHRNVKPVLFIDNVDQLASSYQAQVFLLAQRITQRIGSITIIALREESYYTASVQRTFTASTNHKFHIASPRFLHLIRNRIDYSRELLTTPETKALRVPEQDSSSRDDISDFLTIAEESILEGSKQIVYFVDALCFGNMRLALQMFTTFLASGATDVGKMLYIYRRDGRYVIAYHEFVKSIMLGDRNYYKESASPILNVFDCGIEKNSGHFTALRLLRFLVRCRGQNTPEGRGYFDIGRAAAAFENIFDNTEDFAKTLDRLVQRQLVEVNTRSLESASAASHVRVTSSGWYYHGRLVNSFVYLDLVLQDTPLNDLELAKQLRDSVYKVDNLNDPEEDKIQRVNVRFDRVYRFIDYLEKEEQAEDDRYGLSQLDSVFSEKFVPGIRKAFDFQRDHIGRRIAENREKYIDDSLQVFSETDRAELNTLLEEHGSSAEEETF